MGTTYECDNPDHGPANISRWNTGRLLTPPITNPDVWYSFRDDLWGTPCFDSYNDAVPVQNTCPRIFPELGTGRRRPARDRQVRLRGEQPEQTKFPPYYDDAVFFGEWTRDYLREIRIDSNNKVFKINNVAELRWRRGRAQPFECDNPMDGQFGADGNFYLLTYGDGFFAPNPDAGVYRWSYVKGQRAPNAVLNTDRTDGAVPLTVQFIERRDEGSGSGRRAVVRVGLRRQRDDRLDGPGRELHVHDAGVYVAKLTVTDSNGKSDVKTVTITAGNTSPTVTINTPVDGDFFDWGERIPYTVTVTDPEDGPIDCSPRRGHVHPGPRPARARGRVEDRLLRAA